MSEHIATIDNRGGIMGLITRPHQVWNEEEGKDNYHGEDNQKFEYCESGVFFHIFSPVKLIRREGRGVPLPSL